MKLISLLAAALAFAAAVALAVPARAQSTFYDQQYTAGDVSTGGGIRTLGQSFTPTASAMNTASFFLRVLEPYEMGDTVTFYVQVLAGAGLDGAVLGQSADVTVAQSYSGGFAEVRFPFPAAVALTPGNPYTLALLIRGTTGSQPFDGAQGSASDDYAGGQSYNSDVLVDLNFREGITYPATVTTVHSFTGSGDGEYSEAGLIQANDGNLYGTTQEGGANGDGTVFMVSTDGTTFQTLHAFDYNGGGIFPVAGLLQGSDGNLYGTTKSDSTNANGTVFKVSTEGTTFQTLHFFTDTDGQSPQSVLIQGSDGYLYGTTYFGGANDDGAVFKVSTDGTTFQTLHAFNGTDGEHPFAGLLQASDGNLYGTTAQGGSGGVGSVFKVSTDGTAFQTVYSFDVSDAFAGAALIQAGDGYLYGTAEGSVNNDGTVFKVSTDGKTFQRLHTFTGADGNSPVAGLLLASDGNLYGTTYNGGANDAGTAFMVSTDGATFATLYGFGSVSGDGNTLFAGLLQASDGNLYGTTNQGGANGYGEVYEAALRLPYVVQFHLVQNSVNETAGTATVRVDRIGDNGSDELVVRYTLTDGTAKVNTDYTDGSGGELIWDHGDVTPRFITVNIVNHGDTDGSLRTLRLSLGNPQFVEGSGTTLGYPATATLTIDGSIPGAPVILHPKTATGTQGTAFVGRIDASASPTSYAASGLPDGLSVNVTTGKISGTPTGYGVSNVTLNATNAAGTGTATLTLTVHERKPAITSAETDTAQVGQPYSYQIVATGGTPLTYAVSGLFDGLAVDANTGQITGTPEGSGLRTLTLRATNAAGSTTQTLTLTVNPKTPIITSDLTVEGTVGTAFGYQIKATSSPTSFTIEGTPPDGLMADQGAGSLTGTPTESGTFMLTIKAANAGGQAQQTLTLTIYPIRPVITNTQTQVNLTVGQALDYQITASNAPTRYGVQGLFDGITVDQQTGAITGTPTGPGVHTLTLQAANGAGTGTEQITVTVSK